MSKRMLKILLILSLAFNLAVIAALVYAYTSGRRQSLTEYSPSSSNESIVRRRCQRIAKALGLSGDHMALFEKRFMEFSSKREELRKMLMEERDELAEMLSAPESDMASIEKKIDRISQIQAELEKLDVRRLLQLKEVLTPEQKNAFMQMLRCRMGQRENCPRMRRMWHRVPDEGGRRP